MNFIGFCGDYYIFSIVIFKRFCASVSLSAKDLPYQGDFYQKSCDVDCMTLVKELTPCCIHRCCNKSLPAGLKSVMYRDVLHQEFGSGGYIPFHLFPTLFGVRQAYRKYMPDCLKIKVCRDAPPRGFGSGGYIPFRIFPMLFCVRQGNCKSVPDYLKT